LQGSPNPPLLIYNSIGVSEPDENMEVVLECANSHEKAARVSIRQDKGLRVDEKSIWSLYLLRYSVTVARFSLKESVMERSHMP
jgi:hypothetical protein